MTPDPNVCGGVESSQQSVADDVHKHWEAVDGLHVAQDGEPVALQRARKQGENSWPSESKPEIANSAYTLRVNCLILKLLGRNGRTRGKILTWPSRDTFIAPLCFSSSVIFSWLVISTVRSWLSRVWIKSSMPEPGVKAKSRGIIILSNKRGFDGFFLESMTTEQNQTKSNDQGSQTARRFCEVNGLHTH